MPIPLSRPTVGVAAPAISLVDTTGNPWALADHGGNNVVLIFHRHIH